MHALKWQGEIDAARDEQYSIRHAALRNTPSGKSAYKDEAYTNLFKADLIFKRKCIAKKAVFHGHYKTKIPRSREIFAFKFFNVGRKSWSCRFTRVREQGGLGTYNLLRNMRRKTTT